MLHGHPDLKALLPKIIIIKAIIFGFEKERKNYRTKNLECSIRRNAWPLEATNFTKNVRTNNRTNTSIKQKVATVWIFWGELNELYDYYLHCI